MICYQIVRTEHDEAILWTYILLFGNLCDERQCLHRHIECTGIGDFEEHVDVLIETVKGEFAGLGSCTGS